MNRVFLIGNLSKSPKIYESDSRKIAFLSVATNENWTKDGKKHSHTDWHDVVVYNSHTVSFVSQYLKVGDLVHVEGKLRHRMVANDRGEQRKVSEIVVSQFCGDIKSLCPKENKEEEGVSSAPQEPSKNTEQNTKKLEEMGYVLEPVTDFGMGYKIKEEEEVF